MSLSLPINGSRTVTALATESLRLRSICTALLVFSSGAQAHSQGYIVPNGVVYSGYLPTFGYLFEVLHDPDNLYYTGFGLDPRGITPPSVHPNTFRFSAILDVSVRVFLTSAGDPFTQESIQSGSHMELMFQNYVFEDGIPFYLGLYTGNQKYYPENGIYSDPLFGWALLVNNQGTIQLLDGALAYQAGGIYAGTQTLIPVPEPSALALAALGALLLGWQRWRNPRRRWT